MYMIYNVHFDYYMCLFVLLSINVFTLRVVMFLHELEYRTIMAESWSN